MLMEKLLSGKLKKHSEQLNKFVAGFFDTDGSVYLFSDRGRVYIRSSIGQAASNDPDFEVLRALQRHYKLGALTYYCAKSGVSSQCLWNLGSKDSKKLFNLIGKHLNIKAQYFKTCIEIDNQRLTLSSTQYNDLKCLMKIDRTNSKYLKRPKHLSYAYTSGVIAGDGHLRCKSFVRKDRPHHACNRLDIIVELKDEILIELLQESFKGSVSHPKSGCVRWQRGVGRMNERFASKFIPKIRKYMLLRTKRDVLDRMLKFHSTARRD